MQFDNTRTFNWEGAFHGMRAPLESWAKSDSMFGIAPMESTYDLEMLNTWRDKEYPDGFNTEQERTAYNAEKISWIDNNGILRCDNNCMEFAFLGPADLDLAQRLIKAGPEHRKFLRQIFVSAYISLPLSIWKQLDTYKIGTVTNSTSTMHKIQSKPLTRESFEIEQIPYEEQEEMEQRDGIYCAGELNDLFDETIQTCEDLRKAFNQTKDKRYWRKLIELLPESYIQAREYTLNYEVLRSIVHQRKGHKLGEWQKFIQWVHTLPYAGELIFYDGDK